MEASLQGFQLPSSTGDAVAASSRWRDMEVPGSHQARYSMISQASSMYPFQPGDATPFPPHLMTKRGNKSSCELIKPKKLSN